MPHQDQRNVRTNWQALKAVFAGLFSPAIDFKRHGNAVVEPVALAATAIICWGWSKREALNDRVTEASTVVRRLFRTDVTASRQGLLQALATCGESLVHSIVDHFASRLSEIGWRRYGRPTFAVDGTKFAAPQTADNEALFAARAASKKRKRYKKHADAKKANTVQVLTTVLWHLGSGLPFRWRIEDAQGSETKSLQAMLEELPRDARVVADAAYIGYPLWSRIINSGRTFVIRVGSNVTLLKKLGNFKGGADCVFCWPNQAIRGQKPPLALRLITVHTGRKPICLVTNELDLTDEQAGELYRQRWGVEVFFRTVKQSCQRRKLRCSTPQNVTSELHWTLLGIWLALFVGKQSLRASGTPLARMSPVKVLRAFGEVVVAVAWGASELPLLFAQLAAAVNADESRRTTSKASRDASRKKRHHQCGRPKLKPATREQKQLAKLHFL